MPNLVSIGVNDGTGVFITSFGSPHAVLLAGQQSVVQHLRLTFDVPVLLAPDAVTIAPKAMSLVLIEVGLQFMFSMFTTSPLATLVMMPLVVP